MGGSAALPPADQKGTDMHTHALVVDTELLGLLRNAGTVSIPACVQVAERGPLTLLWAAIHDHRQDCRRLKATLRQHAALLTDDWLAAERVEAALAGYEPPTYRYLIAKAGCDDAYLNFGAVWMGLPRGNYRVVRVPQEHLDWLHTRLASGLQLGCSDVCRSLEEAGRVIDLLHTL